MKQLVICLFLLSITIASYAQRRIPANAINPSMGFGGTTGGILELEDATRAPQGTLYYSKKWLLGTVQSTDKYTIKNSYYRYNLKTQSLIIKMDDDNVRYVPNRYISIFEFKDEQGQLHRFENAKGYTLDGVPIVGFVEFLHKDGFEIIYRHHIRVRPADNSPYGLGPKEPEYLTEIDAFVANEKKELTPIKRKKDLYPFLGDKLESMKVYFRKNRVIWRKYDSMNKMLNYYKQL